MWVNFKETTSYLASTGTHYKGTLSLDRDRDRLIEIDIVLLRTTDHGLVTGKLYHLGLRVECTLFLFTKPGANPRRIGDRLV
jgi:hypothetical protein